MGYSLRQTGARVQELLDKIENSKLVTSIDGLEGGTLKGPLSLSGGDKESAAKIILDQNKSGQITDTGTATLLGFLTDNATSLSVGSSSYGLSLRGNGDRPTYNGTPLALSTDTPSSGLVTSVNGKQGAVTLTASDVSALPANTNFVSSVNGSTGAVTGLATTEQVNAKYTKPSGGIPKTDLASDVQTSLSKADTALQGSMSLVGNTLYITLTPVNDDTSVTNSAIYNDIY